MAKAPRAGLSKTRLVPHLRPEEAAAMSGAFLHDVTSNLAEAAGPGGIVPYTAYAPFGTEDLLRPFLAPGTRLMLADGSAGDDRSVTGFGRCLLQAVRGMLDSGHDAACVLNADSPNLPTRNLLAAHAALERADCIVMGMAEDGGYYLLGMRRAYGRMFGDIEWSTGSVAAQTRRRAAELALPVVELDPWYDVDDPPSLTRLIHDLDDAREDDGNPGAYRALYTRACIERLALRSRLPQPA